MYVLFKGINFKNFKYKMYRLNKVGLERCKEGLEYKWKDWFLKGQFVQSRGKQMSGKRGGEQEFEGIYV